MSGEGVSQEWSISYMLIHNVYRYSFQGENFWSGVSLICLYTMCTDTHFREKIFGDPLESPLGSYVLDRVHPGSMHKASRLVCLKVVE